MLVFAADHGLADEGVSPFPKEVTAQMVLNFLQKGAAINVFCEQNNMALNVVDCGVDYDFEPSNELIIRKVKKGTASILKSPAMSMKECRKAMLNGAEVVEEINEKGCNTIGFGEMGIGNTSAAALIMHKICKLPLLDCVGKGTGHNPEGLKKKIEILERASKAHHISEEPQEILATYGGLEIASIAGAMLKAAELNMVLLIDGFIATSALLIAHAINPGIIQNCVFCHQSDEKGHKLMLKHLNAEPVLSLGLRLGEGTGAALALPIIQASVNFLNNMASFEQAGVSNKE